MGESQKRNMSLIHCKLVALSAVLLLALSRASPSRAPDAVVPESVQETAASALVQTDCPQYTESSGDKCTLTQAGAAQLVYMSNGWDPTTGLQGSVVEIPEGTTHIADYAFESKHGLLSVTIPDSVTTIGKSAFAFCSRLRSVTMGNSVTKIGDEAFSRDSKLT